MGLDMYLTGKIFLSEYFSSKDMKATIDNVMPADLRGKVKEVSFEVGYWRKANAIHRWFVENVQGGEDECKPHDVEIDQLLELKSACEAALANRKSGKVARAKLPTQSGFFFGSQEYDDWYFEDLEHTVKVVDEAIALQEKYTLMEFEYCSSW